MKYTKTIFSLSIITFFTPFVALGALNGINDLLISFGRLVGTAIPITFALGVLFFFWGVAQFILAAGNPTAKEKGRSVMVWGIIALFVMASVWGLVKFLGDALGISTPVNGTQSTDSGGSFYCPPGDAC